VDTPLVGTLEIIGVDRTSPQLGKYRTRFRKRAVSAETAAAAIVRGVLRDEYLVFTSPDIRIGHWFQRWLGFVYNRSMRRMNDSLNRVARTMSDAGSMALVEERS